MRISSRVYSYCSKLQKFEPSVIPRIKPLTTASAGDLIINFKAKMDAVVRTTLKWCDNELRLDKVVFSNRLVKCCRRALERSLNQ